MPNKFYPLLFISLLGIFLCFLGWSAFQASTKGTQVTDRDYYSKGLRYNSTQLEKRAASTLGWQLETTLYDRRLLFRLRGKSGSAVSGATGLLNLYSRPDTDLLRIPLLEIDSGLYQAELPPNLQGEVTIRIEIERDGARINRQLMVTL